MAGSDLKPIQPVSASGSNSPQMLQRKVQSLLGAQMQNNLPLHDFSSSHTRAQSKSTGFASQDQRDVDGYSHQLIQRPS